MPQCIFRYHKDTLSAEEVSRIGHHIRPLVAAAASTERVPFTEKDIEWIPEPYNPGASGVEVAIELRTIGFPERKKKLGRGGALALREKIIAVPGFPHVDPSTPILWIQWQDPDGLHI